MGTPNITGQYSGTYNIVVRASETGPDGNQLGKVQAFSGPQSDDPVGVVTWTWDFDNQTVTLEDGRLTPQNGIDEMPADSFDYEARNINDETNVLPLVDVGDGTYTVEYRWKVKPNGLPLQPTANTDIRLEITQLKDGSIAVVTYRDPNGNGIPGTPLPVPFPRGATPDWRGRAKNL